MIDLEDLRSFVEVVDKGGFNKAAASLGISKSIISRRIGRLEEELGVRLLSRSTRGINPTEAGLEFKSRGERILSGLEEAREAVTHHGGAVAGRLRVSLPLSFGVRHVAPVLTELARLHPALEIDASYSDRVVDIVGERYDAAVRIGNLKDSTLVARKVAPVRPIVVASPSYFSLRGRPETPDDLGSHECLIYTGQTSPEWRFRMGRRWMDFRPEGRLRSDSSEAILQWAIAGLGMAAMPSFLVSDAINDGHLEAVLSDYEGPELGIFVVRPPGGYLPGKVRVFIDALVERFGGEPDWDPCLLKRPIGAAPAT